MLKRNYDCLKFPLQTFTVYKLMTERNGAIVKQIWTFQRSIPRQLLSGKFHELWDKNQIVPSFHIN